MSLPLPTPPQGHPQIPCLPPLEVYGVKYLSRKWSKSNWKCIDPQEVFLTSGAVLEGISRSALDFWCFVGFFEIDFRYFL